MSHLAKRILNLERTVTLWSRAEQLRETNRIDEAWSDLWTSGACVEDNIAPPRYGDKQGITQIREDVDAVVFCEAIFHCGATYYRCWAQLFELAEIDVADCGVEFETSAEYAAALHAHADWLDDKQTPDLSAYRFDSGTYARDEAGQFVWGTDELWTWRDRLEAIRRFHRTHGGRFGGHSGSPLGLVRRRLALGMGTDRAG